MWLTEVTSWPVRTGICAAMAGYFLDICLGHPPQCSEVMLDISAADSFVTSVNSPMTYAKECGYNSTSSSSYEPNGTDIYVDYHYIKASGILSTDSLHIGGLEIPAVTFQESLDRNIPGVHWDDVSIIHGVLGLTPSSSRSQYNLANPFLAAGSQNLLNAKVFTLRLAEPSFLALGAINSMTNVSNLTYLPLTHESGQFLLNGTWQTPATSVSIGPHSRSQLSWSLSNHTAVFTTVYPYIWIPDAIALEILYFLGFHLDEMFLPPAVECWVRDSLPHITLTLANQEFILTGYDYTFEWELPDGYVICVSAFQPSGLADEEGQQIILGSSFLKNYNAVFDLDNERIGLEKLS